MQGSKDGAGEVDGDGACIIPNTDDRAGGIGSGLLSCVQKL